jgi:hypothetical protein
MLITKKPYMVGLLLATYTHLKYQTSPAGKNSLEGPAHARAIGFFGEFAMSATRMGRASLKTKKFAHRGARTHDHKVKSLALYRLS